MKKLSLLFVLLFAVSLVAQESPSKDESSEDNFQKSSKLKVSLTSISLEKYGAPKPDKSFRAGETVFINIEVQGLWSNDQQQVVVQADLSVPQLSLNKKNIIDASTDSAKTVPMYFQIPIESVQRGGTCTATITIRDMLARTYVVFTTTFKLTI